MLIPNLVGHRFQVRLAGVLLVFVGALGWVSPVYAQNPTLAEIARKEQERRKTTTGTPKVLTNKDLPPSAQQPAAPPPSRRDLLAAATEQKPAEGQKPAGEPEKDETWWKQRIVQARETLRRNESFPEALAEPHQRAVH